METHMRKLSVLLIIMAMALVSVVPGFAQEDEPDDVQTIADIVLQFSEAEEPEFTYLRIAVEAANPTVLEALTDEEAEYTVFAPNDAAFQALIDEIGEDAFNEILEDSDRLTEILLYHVVEGEFMAEDVLGLEGVEEGASVPTLSEGHSLTVTATEDGVTVNGANVIQTDVDAANGVIHVIDQVLIPSEDMEATDEGDAEATDEGDAEATDEGDAETTDDAEATDEGDAEATDEGDAETTDDAEATDEGDAETTDEGDAEATDEGDETGSLDNDPANMTIAEVVTLQTESDAPQFVTLLTAIQAADPSVLETLSDPDGSFTVFAPTDEAFEDLEALLGEEAFAELLENQDQLTEILLYHVVEGEVVAQDILTALEENPDADALSANSLLPGQSLLIEVDEEGTVFVNRAEVITTDIQTANGVIHIINAVLVPTESTD
jgi:uncharacterized surface protein with fasciclin (FAS1) repeats